MKPTLAVFLLSALIALSSAASIARRDASEVKQAKEQFVGLFQWDKIGNIVMEYLNRDAEVQSFVKYLGSEEFKNIIRELDATSEYEQVLSYLEKAGVNAVKIHNVVHVLLGLPTLPVNVTEPHLSGGIMGMVQDLTGVVSKDALLQWFEEWKTSELFQALINLPAQPFIETLAPKLTESPNVQALMAKLEALGVPLNKLNK